MGKTQILCEDYDNAIFFSRIQEAAATKTAYLMNDVCISISDWLKKHRKSREIKKLKVALKDEFYKEAGHGVTIWQGKANEKMGRGKIEVYELEGKVLINYVCDPKNHSCDFCREMALEKPAFEEILESINGRNGPSDYVVPLSFFTSQQIYDSKKNGVPDYVPRVETVIGKPDDYRHRDLNTGRKRHVKAFHTNEDLVSINMENVCNENPLCPLKTEQYPEDPRRLYKKGHSVLLPDGPAKRRKY